MTEFSQPELRSTPVTQTTAFGHQGRTPTPRSGRELRRRHPLRLFVGFISWCTLGAVVAVLLLRALDLSNPLLIAVVSLTSFAAIPLVVGVVGAFVSQGFALRLSAGLVASVFFFVTTPLNAIIGCGPADSHVAPSGVAGEDELTILSANVLFSAGGADELATMIVDSDADVVVLQEMTPGVFSQLADNPLLAKYTHRDDTQSNSSFFTATFSRLPVTPRDMPPYNGRITTTTFPLAEANPLPSPFTMTAVHLSAPMRPSIVPEWKEQLASLAQLPTDEPSVLVGDFNATSDHRPFRTLVASGWTNTHDEKGCGFDATFPSREFFPVPLLRIDHVLVSDHFEVVEVDVLAPTNGSDHLAVLATVRLADTAT